MFGRRKRSKNTRLTPEQVQSRIRGLKAKANGAKAEQIVQASADYFYQLDKSIIVHKRQESLQQKTGADFSLFLPNGAGYLECKSRNSKSIPLDAVAPHQIEQLLQLEEMGHLGLIIVRLVIDEQAHWFLLKASQWNHPTKKSFNVKELEAFKVEMIEVEGLNLINLPKAINNIIGAN